MTASPPPGDKKRAPVGDDYDWILALVRAGASDVRRYLATLASFCAAPGRFGARWAANRAEALNPLGFLATSVAIVGLIAHVGYGLIGGSDNSLAEELVDNLRPYVLYALFGVLAHLLLRRRRLRSSVAMALYAGAGPSSICALVLLILSTAIHLAGHIPPDANIRGSRLPPVVHLLLWLLLVVPVAWFWVSLALSLAGLHGVRRRRAALAVAATQLALAVVAGLLYRHQIRLTGVYMPSLVIWVWNGNRLMLPHWDIVY